MPNHVELLDRVEDDFLQQIRGKTLLGEIVIPEDKCNKLAGLWARWIHDHSLSGTVQRIIDSWPATLSLWLVNEAFYEYESGAYWPFALGKLGISDTTNYSQRIGHAFLRFLEKNQLPRFRRLNTKRSYLGPLLAHAGVPKSCLPEFFKQVVVREQLNDFTRAGDYDELLLRLPRLNLSKTVEDFLGFGDDIARDFVRRSVDVHRLREGGAEEAILREVGLPERVLRWYLDEWANSPAAEVARAATGGTRRIQRPVLILDPLYGLVCQLPGQSLRRSERMVTWELESDAGAVIDRLECHVEPGERETQPDEVVLAESFGQLRVRLSSGPAVLGDWRFPGLSAETPAVFFAHEDSRVLPLASVPAGPVGIACPPDSELRINDGKAPRVIEDHGRIRLGQQELDVRVYDLTSNSKLRLLRDGLELLNVELADAPGYRPRLRPIGNTLPTRSDSDLHLLGRFPAIEIWKSDAQDLDDFLGSWQLAVRSTTDSQVSIPGRPRRLADLTDHIQQIEETQWYRLDLEKLAENDRFGMFECVATGPLGSHAKLRFTVLPAVNIRTDWDERRDHALVSIHTPPGTTCPDLDLDEASGAYLVEVRDQKLRLCLHAEGEDLETELYVPLPAWAIYDPTTGRSGARWNRSEMRLSLDEVSGVAPRLFLRLATPLGTPHEAEVCLRSPAGVELFCQTVPLRDDGRGVLDLASLFANVRQDGGVKYNLSITVEVGRRIELACAEITRTWAPKGVAARAEDGRVQVEWQGEAQISNRRVLARSLLKPWATAHVCAVPDDATNSASFEVSDLCADAGVYQLQLGVYDPWADKLDTDDSVAARFEFGSPSEWARDPLFSDTGLNGYLYRLLLEHYAGIGGNLEKPRFEFDESGAEFANRVLQTRASLSSSAPDRLLEERIDRLLTSVPSTYLIPALAQCGATLDPATVLRAGLLTKPRRSLLSGDDTHLVDVDSAAVDRLWELWPPLGMWADLQLIIGGDGQAESRVTQKLGAPTLISLSPLQANGVVRFCLEASAPAGIAIARVDISPGVSPFDAVRLRGAQVVGRLEGAAASAAPDLVVWRGIGSGWRLEAHDGTPAPAELGALQNRRDVEWTILYPEDGEGFGSAPDAPFVSFVRSGNPAMIEEIRRRIAPLPTSPIGDIKFQEICLDWLLRAAQDSSYLDRLDTLCSSWGEPTYGHAERNARGGSPGQWRAYKELHRRWDPKAGGDPLYAVPYVSWLGALSLLWRGFGWSPPLSASTSELDELGLELLGLLPDLFQYDLLKLLAIIAIDRARTTL